jgi:hypothetical protein
LFKKSALVQVKRINFIKGRGNVMTVQDFAEKVIRKLKYWHMLDDLSDEKYLKIMY